METKFSIPQTKIEEVKYSSDIREVVSEYVTLNKKGRNYFGNCPFHSEKTPSFSVNTEKQIFHCFGCGVGGGVINFIMKIENLSFPEAVKFLADRKGIEIRVKPVSKKEQEETRQKELIFSSLKKTAEIYQMNLISEAGKTARDYLEKREISDGIREKFKLGFSRESWDDLTTEFHKSKIPHQIGESAGLLMKKKGGGYYDRFRGRIMFPIFDLHGRVIAFGGRTIKGEEPNEPKYLNSPETNLYKKRYVLYGLNFSGSAIREEKSIILVEGYFDLISLFACGIENVAATSGTSLTKEHAMLIRRYTDNVLLLFDPDLAGVKAAFRGIEILLSHDFSVKIASIPKGDDPDSYSRKHGKDGILNLIGQAKPFMEYFIEKKVEGLNLNSPRDQLRCIQDVKPMLSRLSNQIERMNYIEMLSTSLKVDKNIVIDEISKDAPSKKRRVKQILSKSHIIEEQAVLGLIVNDIEKLEKKFIDEIDPFYFKSEKVREAFNLLLSLLHREKGTSISLSFDEIEESETKKFLLETASIDWSEYNRDQTLFDFIQRGKLILLKNERSELQKRLVESDQSDDDEALKILQEKVNLLKKIIRRDE